MWMTSFLWRSKARSSTDPDGSTFVVLDLEGSRQQWGRMLATVLAMALFFFAASEAFDWFYVVDQWMLNAYWMFILSTLLVYRALTPLGAVLGIRVTAHGVRLRSLLVRRLPRTDTAAGIRGCGALPLGLGRAAPSTFLPFSEMEEVYRTGDSLLIRMHDNRVHELQLSLTESHDIGQIVQELQDALAQARAAGFADRAQSDAARARLSQVVPDKR